MNDKYVVVEWPESQYFIGRDDCLLICDDIGMIKFGSSAYFVPEKVYNDIYGKGYNVSGYFTRKRF